MRHAIGIGASLTMMGAVMPALAAAPPVNPQQVCGTKVYVTNSYDDTISVIDTRTNRIVDNYKTDKAPVNPTFTRDWRKVYVANSQAGTLGIIDAATGKLVSTIPAGGPKPSGLRFTPDGKRLIISLLGETLDTPASIAVMDLASGEIVKRIPVQAQSERFDISPDGKRAYVANLRSQSVSVVDLEAGTVLTTIPIAEPYPFNVLAAPSGDKVYVAHVKGSAISVIDPRTNRVLNTIKTAAGPNGITFSPDHRSIYVTDYIAGVVEQIDVASGRVTRSAPTGEEVGFIRLTPDGRTGYYAWPRGTDVSVMDMQTLRTTHRLTTGKGPSTLAICGNP